MTMTKGRFVGLLVVLISALLLLVMGLTVLLVEFTNTSGTFNFEMLWYPVFGIGVGLGIMWLWRD